ncbi:hypothetical protein IPL68_01660 [Candidatus Saccharibacteria bacterium]|nr:MAG: hypothetical protein IPL68_01660 [Candidatus Saccharibacteria bacterium]
MGFVQNRIGVYVSGTSPDRTIPLGYLVWTTAETSEDISVVEVARQVNTPAIDETEAVPG